jgi:hypothetical protein
MLCVFLSSRKPVNGGESFTTDGPEFGPLPTAISLNGSGKGSKVYFFPCLT